MFANVRWTAASKVTQHYVAGYSTVILRSAERTLTRGGPQ